MPADDGGDGPGCRDADSMRGVDAEVGALGEEAEMAGVDGDSEAFAVAGFAFVPVGFFGDVAELKIKSVYLFKTLEPPFTFAARSTTL